MDTSSRAAKPELQAIFDAPSELSGLGYSFSSASDSHGTIFYFWPREAVKVENSTAITLTLDGPGWADSDAGGDRLSGIENLIGSAHDDRLTGDSRANVIEGRRYWKITPPT